MGDRSKIAWTEATWNPIRGTLGRWHCTKVSAGCVNCYAERMNIRFGGPKYTPNADMLQLNETTLTQPRRWKRPRLVFVESMSDLFHEDVPCEWIDRIIGAMLQSGPKARPMDTDWVRTIRDQCVPAGVPFFFKQQIVNGRKVEVPELDGHTWEEYPPCS